MTIQEPQMYWHHYHSFLLRLWREYNDGQLAWRASLESVQTGEKIAFASLAELFTFLDCYIVLVNQEDEEEAIRQLFDE